MLTINLLLTITLISSILPYNAAFMYGKIYVRVIFVESIGITYNGVWKERPSREDWSTKELEYARNQSLLAFEWWKKQLPKANLEFIPSFEIKNTIQEPVTDPDDLTWINEILDTIYPELSYTTYNVKSNKGAELDRERYNVDSSITLFIVNNSDTNARFINEKIGMHLSNTPLITVMYTGLPVKDGLAAAIAHELAHPFGALDQYYNDSDYSGYLQAPNYNTQYKQNSIMLNPAVAFHTEEIDTWALEQIGYRDNNCNGKIDPIDIIEGNEEYSCYRINIPIIFR